VADRRGCTARQNHPEPRATAGALAISDLHPILARFGGSLNLFFTGLLLDAEPEMSKS
jgi:hypothetical protein